MPMIINETKSTYFLFLMYILNKDGKIGIINFILKLV